jgi:hypothetical protein
MHVQPSPTLSAMPNLVCISYKLDIHLLMNINAKMTSNFYDVQAKSLHFKFKIRFFFNKFRSIPPSRNIFIWKHVRNNNDAHVDIIDVQSVQIYIFFSFSPVTRFVCKFDKSQLYFKEIPSLCLEITTVK